MPDEIPHFLAYTQGFLPDDKTKYERIDQADDDRLYFFANYKDNSKVIIMYDPDWT